ncbi:ribosomal protein L7/L12 [Streptomyces sp. NPDC048659]|uniref:ribosomal protein L7/L12 n=1 Tax=Streptomyces sp. NPDC048659 TaxID=3155489 RepID=UPI0034315DA6
MDDGDETVYVTLICAERAYDVVLLKCGPREMDVVQAVRRLTGLSLWHSRVLTRQVPVTVMKSWPQDDADDAVAVLRSAGARAEAGRNRRPTRARPHPPDGPQTAPAHEEAPFLRRNRRKGASSWVRVTSCPGSSRPRSPRRRRPGPGTCRPASAA